MSNSIYEIITYIIGFFVLLTLFKNYIFLIIAPFYEIKERFRYIKHAKKVIKTNNLDVFNPVFSIVVPAWNEEVGIIRTIESIIHNGYKNYQLIIVNDGSTDKTDKIVRRFIKKLNKSNQTEIADKITYIYQENSGKGAALNNGIKHATGDIVVTVDADSVLKKGSLKNLVKYYIDPNIMAVVGNVQVSNVRSLVGLAQHIEYYLGFYNKRTHAVLGAEYIFGGACASFRRSVFKEIGGFDEVNKTEDIEMSMRIRFQGYSCTYAEDVICYTEGASDVRSLISQRVRWKKGRFDTFIKYKSMFLSANERYNFSLSFFVLPFSLLMEFQLLFEPIAISILVIYSIITMEFLSLAIGISFIFCVYLIISIFSNERIRPGLFMSAPFTWPIFYFLDWVEFVALIKSLSLLISNQDVEWQDWKREGI